MLLRRLLAYALAALVGVGVGLGVKRFTHRKEIADTHQSKSPSPAASPPAASPLAAPGPSVAAAFGAPFASRIEPQSVRMNSESVSASPTAQATILGVPLGRGSEQKPLWMSGYTVKGGMVNVQLSDGRIITEKDVTEVAGVKVSLIRRVERNFVEFRDGTKVYARPSADKQSRLAMNEETEKEGVTGIDVESLKSETLVTQKQEEADFAEVARSGIDTTTHAGRNSRENTKKPKRPVGL